jgi:hypothetical protein
MIRRLYCALFFLFLASYGFSKEPSCIYLAWQEDPTSSMTVQWLTPIEDKTSLLEYKKLAPESDILEWKTAEITVANLPQNEPYTIHKAAIKELKPDSVYEFRLSHDGTRYRFRTMPEKLTSRVRFIVGGDACPESLVTFEETCKAAAKQDPRFVILGGDLAYSVSKKRQRKDDFGRWLSFLTSWSNTMKDSNGCLIPLLTAIGNHEVLGQYDRSPEDAPFFYSLFAWPGMQGYNVLRFNKYMSIIFLDSGHTHTIYGEQTEWLREQLKKDQGILNRFAVYHVPAFPSVRYFRLKESCSIRRNWVPLFERYGMSAVFENHDHAYKRTHPLLEGSRDPYGIVYFGDGSWGCEPRVPKKAEKTTYLAKTAQSRQFLVVDITPTTRFFQAVTPQGEVIDQYAQEVIP